MATVMIVEDYEDIREMMAETLRLEGYDVLEAEHGQHALDVLQQAKELPCLILMDLMMPVMSGIELLKNLEENGKLAQIPVVVISAGGQPEHAKRAAGFLRKPPSQDLLLKLVHEYCSRVQT